MDRVEAILKQNVLDGYMKGVLGGFRSEKVATIERLSKIASEHPDYPNVVAACWTWAGDLSEDRAATRSFYSKAWNTQNTNPGYREALEDRLLFDSSTRKPWPKNFKAPRGMEHSPGPWSDPDSTTVQPDSTSRAQQFC